MDPREPAAFALAARAAAGSGTTVLTGFVEPVPEERLRD